MEQWNVVKPGGPAALFWSIVTSSGVVIAMQIPNEATAKEIVALRAERDQMVADAAWLRGAMRAGRDEQAAELEQLRQWGRRAYFLLEVAAIYMSNCSDIVSVKRCIEAAPPQVKGERS